MICRNCNHILTGDEDYCPHCGVPLKLNTEDDSRDVKDDTDTQEMPEVRPDSKNTIFDTEPIYVYSTDEEGQRKSKKKPKKKVSGVAVTFLVVFFFTVLSVGVFVAAEYLGIVPAISLDLKKETTGLINTNTTEYVTAGSYSDSDGIVSPDISYKPSLCFVSAEKGLSLRKGSDDRYAQIHILPHGKQVQVIGGSITKEDWVYVYVPDDDLYGWLCSSFLTSKQAFSQEITDSVSEEYSQNTDIMDTTA